MNVSGFWRRLDRRATTVGLQATTGPEILADFKGKQLDYWVTGYGTGGTFHGAGKAIKAARPDVKVRAAAVRVVGHPPRVIRLATIGLARPHAAGRADSWLVARAPSPAVASRSFLYLTGRVVFALARPLIAAAAAAPPAPPPSRVRALPPQICLAEPTAAGLLASGTPTPRNADGSPKESHPAFAAHPIQGWTPDFIPQVLEKGMDLKLADEMVPVPGDEAIATAKALAANEGLLTGISGGGTMYAALEVAKKAPKGSVVLAMLPDTGERYLTTPLFASIDADMNEEELEIAKSTPSFQLLPDPSAE